MRLTPAQVAVRLICGHQLPMGRRQPLEDRMQAGRAMLVRIAKVDYGYDLQRWHDHLKAVPRSESLGYSWNRTIVLPKIMEEALASEEWRSAARALAGGT
jgi:hypothetical protein